MPPRVRRMPARRAAPLGAAPLRAAPGRAAPGRGFAAGTRRAVPAQGWGFAARAAGARRAQGRVPAGALGPALSALSRGLGRPAAGLGARAVRGASASVIRAMFEREETRKELRWEKNLEAEEEEALVRAMVKEANGFIGRGTPEAFADAEQLVYKLVANGRQKDAENVIKFLIKELRRKGHNPEAFAWEHLLENPKEFEEALRIAAEQKIEITSARQLEHLVRQMKGQ